MDSKTYESRVLETESKPGQIQFGTLASHAVLGLIAKTANIVDVAKKAMFYGRAFDVADFQRECEELTHCAQSLYGWAEEGVLTKPTDIAAYNPGELPDNIAGLNLDNINKRLLHVILGVSSEAGEMADALVTAWEGNKPVDRVNFCEEVGDVLWYLGVASSELNAPFTTLFEQNIAKLQDKKDGRYKQGSFDVDAANFRDLDAERRVLEQEQHSEVKPELLAALHESTMARPLTAPETPVTPALENKWAAQVRANDDHSYSGLDANGNEVCRLPYRSAVIQTLERYDTTLVKAENGSWLMKAGGELVTGAKNVANAALDAITDGAEAAKNVLNK